MDFVQQPIRTTQQHAQRVIPVDIDFNGDMDIITSYSLTDEVVLEINNGIDDWQMIQVGGSIVAMFALPADIDGDGDLDIVAVGLFDRNTSFNTEGMVDRLRFLASVFAVEVCSYAIMSNHYHLVIRIRKDTAENWSDDHVLKQWFKLYKPDIHLINVYRKGVQLGKAERAFVKQWIQERRDILYSMSRFMQCLNQYIATLSNREDDCTGAFFEKRFKSQALLDEQAILTAMACGFKPCTCQNGMYTGRIQREDKRGYISHHSTEVLERLGINPTAFTQQMSQSCLGFSIALGCQQSIRAFAGILNQHFIKDGGLSQWLFDDPNLE